jgi:UDP-glucose 4-epimerase
MANILVVGGAGFIGSAVATRYLQDGHSVSVVDNLSAGHQKNVPKDARFFVADIRDRKLLETIFSGVRPEIVSHHAAQMDVRKSVADPFHDADVNILGSLSVLECCVQHSVKKIIYASSGGAIYGSSVIPKEEWMAKNPISHYGVSKLTVEQYLEVYMRLYGLEYVALRYANVYGPGQNPHGKAGIVAIFIDQMLNDQPATIFGYGSKTRDYVFIDDVVEANVLALTAGNGPINIGTGIHSSDFEIFARVRKATSYKQDPIYLPPRVGEIDNIALNANVAARGLKWKAKIDLDEGIARTVRYNHDLNTNS